MSYNLSDDLSAYFNTQADNENPKGAYVPMVVEDTKNGRVSQDVFSRLLKERIVLLDGPVDDAVAATIKAQMQFLEASDPDKPIHFYINSPGGVVTAGLAMFDTMKSLKCPVATYGIGQNCSMGSFLLAAGTKGMRYATPSTRVMTHQPSGGTRGQMTDQKIHVEEGERLKYQLTAYYMHFMDMDMDQKDFFDGLFERDTFFNALAAKELGHIDHIIEPKNEKEKDLFALQMDIMKHEIANDEKIPGLIKMRQDHLASKKPSKKSGPKPKQP